MGKTQYGCDIICWNLKLLSWGDGPRNEQTQKSCEKKRELNFGCGSKIAYFMNGFGSKSTSLNCVFSETSTKLDQPMGIYFFLGN